MLTEQRQEQILQFLNKQGSVTVQELTEQLKASESTIRRDLNVLDKKGMLTKVFGGAVRKESPINTREEKMSFKKEQRLEEKIRIARCAASLVEPGDFIYLDAGTTTGCMIPFLTERSAFFVTNAASHALRLAENGFRVHLIGGELKASTEALVGNDAYAALQKFHFTKGFFGANGVSRTFGFTTPDINEAMIKECAFQHTQSPYVLCDADKFQITSPVCFGEFSAAHIITDRLPEESFRGLTNLTIAEA